MFNLPFFFLFLLHISLSAINFTAQSLTLPTDISALQDIKKEIEAKSIPPNSCVASWNFSAADPCFTPRRTYFLCGLTCQSTAGGPARVTQLTLDPAGYYGILSPKVCRLTALKILDVSDNFFYGSIPPLGSLSHLQTLSLSSNSFGGNLPPSIANLKFLQSLDVSGNFLNGSLPQTLDSLNSLTKIDLSYNRFTGSLPKFPPKLTRLALRGNSLSGPLPRSSFVGLNQLDVVELAANSFSGVVPSWFFLISSLQQANLANNSLIGFENWAPTAGNSTLVALDMGFNIISGNISMNLDAFPKLASLSLRYNQLKGPIPAKFGGEVSLRRLFLDGNFLSGTPPAGLLSPSVSGSLGYNCLQDCPSSSPICSPAQKPVSLCG